MTISEFMAGCQDAQDWPGTAACVLAHPISQKLSERAVERLYGLAWSGFEATRCDVAMLGVMAEAISEIEGRA